MGIEICPVPKCKYRSIEAIICNEAEEWNHCPHFQKWNAELKKKD